MNDIGMPSSRYQLLKHPSGDGSARGVSPQIELKALFKPWIMEESQRIHPCSGGCWWRASSKLLDLNPVVHSWTLIMDWFSGQCKWR